MEASPHKHAIALIDIRSVYNVGSIFRTADGAGIYEVLLVGTTPTPQDRFGRIRKDMHKTALGATEYVVWKYFETTAELFDYVHTRNYMTVAVEQDQKSIPYTHLSKDRAICLLVGNEVNGIAPELLDRVDSIVELPMRGQKKSLNVSVAAGVLMYELLRGDDR